MEQPASRLSVLVAWAGGRRCAFRLAELVETLRPLPVQAIPRLPAYLSGLARIRGQALPVIDLGPLLGAAGIEPARFLVVRAGARRLALAVDAVEGLRELEQDRFAALPVLLRAAQATAIDGLADLDDDLMWLLGCARLIDEPVWRALDEAAAGAQAP